jgi:hypothetical protein
VTCSSCAARLTLRWRAAASKARRALRGQGEFVHVSFLTACGHFMAFRLDRRALR